MKKSAKYRQYQSLCTGIRLHKRGYASLLLAMCSILIALTSCRPYGAEVTTALKLAGENRAELEKVLEYYSGDKSDSLKLKATEFLICNMDVHFSYRKDILPYRTRKKPRTHPIVFREKPENRFFKKTWLILG